MMWDYGSTSWNSREVPSAPGARTPAAQQVNPIFPTPMCWPMPLWFCTSAAR
jgi:hypothetical protein